MNNPASVEKIVGPWSGDATTSLMVRCRDAWSTPINLLSDLMVSTFIEQKIALPEMMAEAKRRLASGNPDDTELFDGQLLEAVSRAESSNNSLQGRRP